MKSHPDTPSTAGGETPETDAAVVVCDGAPGWRHMVDAEFARSLERRLAVAVGENEELRKTRTDQFFKIGQLQQERDQQERFKWLANERAERAEAGRVEETTHTLLDDAANLVAAHNYKEAAKRLRLCKAGIANVPLVPRAPASGDPQGQVVGATVQETVVVPREPTEAMLDAGRENNFYAEGYAKQKGIVKRIYKAMLSAAPQDKESYREAVIYRFADEATRSIHGDDYRVATRLVIEQAIRNAIVALRAPHEASVSGSGVAWIPVSEEGPPVSRTVLLCANSETVWGWRRMRPSKSKFHYHGAHGVIRGTVTHWMPLPEPPR